MLVIPRTRFPYDLRYHGYYNYNNGTDGDEDDGGVPWYYGGVFTDLVFLSAFVAFVALSFITMGCY